MNNRLKLPVITLAALLVLLAFAPTVSLAQRGGSGGGSGGLRAAGRHLLTMDNTPPINGRVPSGLASYNVSTYQTTLTYNMKVSNVDLPDGTQLEVYVYITDYTGWVPTPKILHAGSMSLVARKGILDLTTIALAASGLLPDVNSVVVTAPDGSVVMSGHP